MSNRKLRQRMGAAGRRRVVELFDYRVVAQKFVEIISRRLSGSWNAAPLEPAYQATATLVSATMESAPREPAVSRRSHAHSTAHAQSGRTRAAR